MTDLVVVQIVREAFYNLFLVAGPILLISLVVGLMISIFQAATSISEQTLTFVPKLVIVMLMIILLLPWIISVLKSFTIQMFTMMTTLK